MSQVAVAHALNHARLQPTQKVVLIALADYAEPEHGLIFGPSLRRLAEIACVSVPTARRAIEALVEGGWVRLEEPGNGQTVTRYRYLFRDGPELSSGPRGKDLIPQGERSDTPHVVSGLPLLLPYRDQSSSPSSPPNCQTTSSKRDRESSVGEESAVAGDEGGLGGEEPLDDHDQSEQGPRNGNVSDQNSTGARSLGRSVFVPTAEEAQALAIVQTIPGYPFDLAKDGSALRAKIARFPDLDPVLVADRWRDYATEKGFDARDRPRAQWLNQFALARKWGLCERAGAHRANGAGGDRRTGGPRWEPAHLEWHADPAAEYHGDGSEFDDPPMPDVPGAGVGGQGS